MPRTLLFILVVGLHLLLRAERRSARFRDVWVGALVTGLLWKSALEKASPGTVRDMSRFTRVNGSIAAAVVMFLVWVYSGR